MEGLYGISISDGAMQRWILSSHITGLMKNFKETVNLAKRKNVPKDLGKTRAKIIKKLCSIATISSKVDKIHSSKVKQLSIFHHKSRHHQKFKKI